MKDGTDRPLVFSPKQDMKVTVFLHQHFTGVNNDFRTITYCTIMVENPDKSYEYYHGATVRNPHDYLCYRQGSFIAFKKALRERWDDKHWKLPEHVWVEYHKKWAHFLATLIDGKVVEDEYLTDQF